MNKNEYRKAIEMICPKEGAKEKLWQQLMQETSAAKTITKQFFSTRVYGYVAAALAIICVAGFSLPTIASEISSKLVDKMPYYEPLTTSIETGIYTNTDGHIEVNVEELLSDGMAVYMTVKYKALDNVGKEWLRYFELKQDMGKFNISLKPDMGNDFTSRTNFSYGTYELTDYTTEDERIFQLKLETMSRDYAFGKGIFTFPLTEGYEETVLDITGNINFHSFVLSEETSPSDFYTPSFIEISKLSFVVYAYNHGVFERKQDGDFHGEYWLMPPEEVDALEENSYFVMADGSKMKLMPGAHGTTYPKEENLNSDVILYSGIFMDYSTGLPVPMTINPEEIKAIIINNVTYEFSK